MLLETNDFITIEQMADLKAVNRRTVYNWLDSENPPRHEVVFGRIVFYKEDALRYVQPTKGRRPLK